MATTAGRVPPRDVTWQAQAGRRTARLGRRGPQWGRRRSSPRRVGRRRVGLARAVAAAADERIRAEDAPRDRHRQVVLPEVEHVGPGGERDVRAVVHGQQAAVPPAGIREHLEQAEFLARLQVLLPELDDVHPGAQDGVETGRSPWIAGSRCTGRGARPPAAPADRWSPAHPITGSSPGGCPAGEVACVPSSRPATSPSPPRPANRPGRLI